jgi:hypothetical protein
MQVAEGIFSRSASGELPLSTTEMAYLPYRPKRGGMAFPTNVFKEKISRLTGLK